MKAFVLSVFDGESTAILMVVLANSREEALRTLGSRDLKEGNNIISDPTEGVDDEVVRDCLNAVFSDIILEEVPVILSA